ncbi:MAG: nucleotidyltransferase family protein [Gemmatimonadaceae bacterium]|nr:nucleotidyltransferase family protein [Gemmatimonadaceae bacterium]
MTPPPRATTPLAITPLATTRAVILARGLGTRMRQADPGATLDAQQAAVADAGVKGMIPIARPFLDYVISALADAGITDVCLIIGPEHQAVRDYYGALAMSRVRVHFAIQHEPRGTADAVAAAREFAADATFLVLNSDNYYPVEAYRALAAIAGSGLVGFEREALVAESNIPEERIRRFALVATDATGALTEIVEKPDEATYARMSQHALVSMNLWSFSPAIFEACAQVQPSPRGELELQDAVRIAMHELGERFTVVPMAAGVLDLSSRRDIPAVAARLDGVTVAL